MDPIAADGNSTGIPMTAQRSTREDVAAGIRNGASERLIGGNIIREERIRRARILRRVRDLGHGIRLSPRQVDLLKAALRLTLHRATGPGLSKCWVYFAVISVLFSSWCLIQAGRSYERSQWESCDQPLAEMLWGFKTMLGCFVLFSICKRFEVAGRTEAWYMKASRVSVNFMIFLWPFIAGIMAIRSNTCSKDLVNAVEVIVAVYVILFGIFCVFPVGILLTYVVLLSRGVVPWPRSARAAPAGFVQQLPKVQFSPELFDDEGAEGCYPATCPVCLDTFDETHDITATNCQPNQHVFHTECLAGWLDRRKTCPLCRADLTAPGDVENGIEMITPLPVAVGA